MMSRDEMRHAFAGNPIIPGKRDKLATEALPSLLHNPQEVERVKVLPLCDGKPLVAASSSSSISSPSCDGPAAACVWRLAWQALEDFGERIPLSVTSSSSSSGENPPQMYDQLVYLGEKERVAYFAIDVPAYPAQNAEGRRPGVDGKQLRSLASMFASPSDDERVAFVDARTLMQAANWSDEEAMSELSIAGHARVMLGWHKEALYCGRCGSKTLSYLSGQRRVCSKCNNKLYPRIDPVVIMLVIDKERDCVILGRQSRFVARMWSCLAGFMEPGESLEEAVRRETREEVGIELGDIVYHSSQPWPGKCSPFR
jgi:NAD+ diphosphatase